MTRIEPSEMDRLHLAEIRQSVVRFMERVGGEYGARGGRLLDIAPQVHEGARPFFPNSVAVETLDIDPSSGCTYISDITRHNPAIPDHHFQFVVCTEVLEHTLQPFHAVAEIHRILDQAGLLFLTVPFNFRIHGPLPDCWRFTEHGLRALLCDFKILELSTVETPHRPLMPIHYTVIAQK